MLGDLLGPLDAGAKATQVKLAEHKWNLLSYQRKHRCGLQVWLDPGAQSQLRVWALLSVHVPHPQVVPLWDGRDSLG